MRRAFAICKQSLKKFKLNRACTIFLNWIGISFIIYLRWNFIPGFPDCVFASTIELRLASMPFKRKTLRISRKTFSCVYALLRRFGLAFSAFVICFQQITQHFPRDTHMRHLNYLSNRGCCL